MSVLVRGMGMPKNCWNCPFFHTSMYHIGDDELLEIYTCLRTGKRTNENVTGYMKNCPLIPVPPHGRLIDADGDIGVNVTMMPGGKCKVDLIAPTIIQAEEVPSHE